MVVMKIHVPPPIAAETPEIQSDHRTRRSFMKTLRTSVGRNARKMLPPSDSGIPIRKAIRMS